MFVNWNGYCELFTVTGSVYIFRTLFVPIGEDESNHKYLEYKFC